MNEKKTRVGKILKVLKETVKGLLLLAFLALLMLWLSGAMRAKIQPGAEERPAPPQGLKTRAVERQSYPLLLEQVGTIKTQIEASLSSRILAQVLEVPVREGDEAFGPKREGAEPTLLARLDDRDIQARLQQARLRLVVLSRGEDAAKAQVEALQAEREAAQASRAQAEADFRRYEELYRSKAATGQQLEQAKAHFEVADAQVRAAAQGEAATQAEIAKIQAQVVEAHAAVGEAQVMLSHTLIRAPFTGRVARKYVEAGETVGPGQVLFLIDTPSKPELEAVMSESLLPHLAAGNRFDVIVDALNLELEGTVREVVPRADPATRTVTVKVSLPPVPGLLGGLFGRLMIRTGEYEALVIPHGAVKTVGQLHLVDVVEAGGYPLRRFVTLGERHGEEVEVLSGLKEGESVVVP